MAGHVKQVVMTVLGTMCLAGCASVWAMGPSEPFLAPRADQAGASQGPEDLVGSAVDGAAPVAKGLSGVRLGRHAGAVIDGLWIRKGREIRGAKLVQIQRTRVTLLHPDGHKEIIEMYPPMGGQAGAVAAASTEAAKP